jgi:retrograde regulation protein 2
VAEVSKCLGRFVGIAREFGVPASQTTVIATEAMRRASNAGEMLGAIDAACPGLSVCILDGKVEALFGAMGARAGFVDVKGLFLDLGGGSVQMSYMDSSTTSVYANNADSYEIVAAQTGQSMPFGAAKLTRILEGEDDKAKKASKSELDNSMLTSFAKICSKFPELARAARGDEGHQGVDIYLCGGGFRGYGSMLMHNDPVQPYTIPLMSSYTVSGEYFRDAKKMRKSNKQHEGKIFGMSKRRRQQFPAIANVVEALCDAIPRINTVTFCQGGNREGCMMMKLPRAVRESNPLLLLDVELPRAISSSFATATARHQAVQGVVAAMTAALPGNVETTPKRPDGPASTFAHFPAALMSPLALRSWERQGLDEATNASAVLHEAVGTRDVGVPGMSHLARALLGLSLHARWGGSTAPADVELLKGLRQIAGGVESEEVFWAEFIGCVVRVVALLIAGFPRRAERVGEVVR